ncbi:DNA repair ATPase [Streptomyces sp. VRA16 Mangrove soil]|uniref:DNA repair ATPase n=1 Tax=Streptomyces sp. VRA16 Mangrove soil TaxID=2817434 RepID=UPI001A9D70C6|nr:DNA repair ATPase [Streptomyces sp. VRA16 Mangrove soil]MBO1332235.1 DNA repair ATPase [Streptomyces sp. VRA16 Mangrove soil]
MDTGVDEGTYEVLRDRLAAQSRELAARAGELNDRRSAAFGSTGLTLTATGAVRTDAPRLARDVVAVGGALLVGQRDVLGTGTPEVGDIFTLHTPDPDRDLERLPDDAVPGLLDDPSFRSEFATLFRYYRDSRLLELRLIDGKLLAVFQTGDKADDIRVLRWELDARDGARFLDARGDRDDVRPPAHDVTWRETTREDHVLGRHPHVRVEGEIFVATVGGSLTVKTEDDTETAGGIHSEPVDEPLQSLADAAVAYARVGPLILLRVRPYKESADRHLVFNTLTKSVVRLDGIGQACRVLPDAQGVVFPGGYCLAAGAHKTFDAVDTTDLVYERTVRAPGGEDVLYVFRARAAGRTLLLPYHLIRKEIATPLTGRGHALFDDGTLVLLRTDPSGEPTRTHAVQTWATPFTADTYETRAGEGDPELARIGNAELVRGIADCLSLVRTVQEAAATPTTTAYEALAAACERVTDTYPWLDELRGPVTELRTTAAQIVTEYATVRALTRKAADALDEAAARVTALVRRIRGEAPRSAHEWVERLTELRRAQGQLLTLKELRYADVERIDALDEQLTGDLASAGARAVAFLARPDALADHHAELDGLTGQAEQLATTAQAAPLAERVTELAEQLRTVTDVVGGLDVDDATVRADVLERIAEALAGVNRARATLDARRRELAVHEGRAEFAAEFSLLGQAVTGALAAATTPEACDDQLARVLLQLENLDGRFAESDDFLADLDAKRVEIREAFAARKQTLADARARHTERLATSAYRILETVARRLADLGSFEEISTFLASDPMVAKVRRTIDALRDRDDQVRADELDGRLAVARQDALRALRDRTELYADGGTTLRLGRHRIAVNTRQPELALVPHGADGMAYALTGTDYRAPVDDPEFAGLRAYWGQSLPSENSDVYRAEHLAARLLAEHGAEDLLARDDLAALVRAAAEDAYDEGYERGVHDHDATTILTALLRLHAGAGLLRHAPAVRAAAQLFWAHGTTADEREAWARRAVSLARARDTFGLAPAIDDWCAELAVRIGSLDDTAPGERRGPGPGADDAAAGARSVRCGAAHAAPDSRDIATYLFEELTTGPAGFVTSAGARTFLDKFRRAVDSSAYEDDLAAVPDLATRRSLVEAWLSAYAAAAGDDAGDLPEAVALELCPDLPRHDADAPLTATVEGLLGTHARVEGRRLTFRLDELLARTRDFRERIVPGFRAYQRLRTSLVAAEHERLRLAEHRPHVLPTFVRSRLVDEVYLPLIGDSLAKQLGTAGGLLLLISPPGYGKTTLVEYVADRLGMLLVKVDGPALGHDVTSLDPAQAPNVTARQEIEKVNFALEAGNNVLLYLDDIQHTSPELLQKFIALCDGQRRMDGVWQGEPRSHDLRGKRFAVCMAGNPYTESGQRFRIPDMLANRADVWNLGDVLTGKEDVFALSFVENALTANPHLAPLAGRDRADLEILLRLAQDDPDARADRLAHPYEPAETERIVAVLRHLLAARDTVLAVNAAYIASAAQSDDARTEPPFLLQGSYRNMNKIAARIDPALNAAELAAVLDDHYAGEAQTLTTGAEANLLKLAELRGRLGAAQAERWREVKAGYVRTHTLGGADGDPVVRAVAALGLLADRVAAVESAISRATDPRHTLANSVARHAQRP